MNKWGQVLAGLAGGAAIGLGLADATVVTGAVSAVSPEAATYASVIGGVFGAALGLFTNKKKKHPESDSEEPSTK